MHLLNATRTDRHPASALNMTLLPVPPVIGLDDIKTREPSREEIEDQARLNMCRSFVFQFPHLFSHGESDAGAGFVREVETASVSMCNIDLKQLVLDGLKDPEFAEEATRHARHKLRLESVIGAMKDIDADVVQWEEDCDSQTKQEAGEVDGASEGTPWNDRLDDTRHILGKLSRALPEYMDKKSLFIYDLNQGASSKLKPAGFILIKEGGGIPEISYLVTHPGTAGVGGALMERAVNLSQRNGFEGKLRIFPTTEEARQCYVQLGFGADESRIMDDAVADGWMMLDPVDSEKWAYMDNVWHLAKYVGTASLAFPDTNADQNTWPG